MSTPAPLLHSAGYPALNQGDDALFWKAELNARLRQHRERRGDRAPLPADMAATPAGRGTPASRVAARVAERYSQAPSYRELLAASAAAAAAAAAAALEAQAAAAAALSGWESGQNEAGCVHVTTLGAGHDASTRSLAADTAPREIGASHDVFADPFFSDSFSSDTDSETPGAGTSAPERTGNAVLAQDPVQFSSAAEGGQSYAPVPFVPAVEHPTPLPTRVAPPERVPVAERARSLVARSSFGSFVDAFAEAVVPAAQSLPAKLIEFPRELIAPRKQRPRLAEGPLFEQASPGVSLRIFEVAGDAAQALPEAAPKQTIEQRAEQFLGEPVLPAAPRADCAGESWLFDTYRVTDAGADASEHHTGGVYSGMVKEHEDELPRRRAGFSLAEDAGTPAPGRRVPRPEASGWGSIRLGEHPQAEGETTAPPSPAARRAEHGYRVESEPALHDLAPIGDRLMSALVDGGIVLSCFLVSLLVFATCTVHPPTGKAAAAIGLIAFGILACFYGWLFMSFGGGSTPGMRYAHIALCTFGDENPTRKDLQNRVPATALALLPLGLGVFWALLDEDKLGWHDRMTRTYQRTYR